ncbi:MAG TPA: acyl-CoA dehydrogenase family protein, partial [Pirellulaceae bacterium]|nr:acyl-CoA dehydrogenase family protein [Pirellulaceae bacterium]
KQPAVFVCELPREECEEFRFRRYELHALKHSHNCGLIFNGLRIPGSSLLESKQGNGLTIAYHGLNRGRVAVCATAAGQLRNLLAGMLAWGGKRVTYGQPIAKRELVTRRIGRMAALIVGCDALSDWCAGLLDQGYRGELECIVAKVFGSEALKEGAIDLALKTHGGRAFVRGHACGDNMHDYLAPTIYEGEGDLLGLALFKGLVKQHATTYFEPLMKAMRQAGLKAPPRWNPLQWWKLRGAAWPYGKWILSRRRPQGSRLPKSLAVSEALAQFSPLVEFATREFTATGLQIDRALRRHQLRLADRQCRMSELAKRVQRLTAMLCVALYGAAQTNELSRAAALVLGNDLQRELTGRPISDAELRVTVELGQSVLRDPATLLADCPPASIVMPYDAG